MAAIGHDDEAHFFALQEVFDDHHVAGGAKLAAEHLLRGADRRVMTGRDHDALARGEAAGLDDDRDRS